MKRASGGRRGRVRVVASSDSDVELLGEESAEQRAGAHATGGAAPNVNKTADEDSDELDVPLIQRSGAKHPQPRAVAPLETPKSVREPLPGRASTRHKTESRGVGDSCRSRPKRLSAQKNKLVHGNTSGNDCDDEAGAKRAREDDKDYKEGEDEDEEVEEDEDVEQGEDDSDWSPGEGSTPKQAQILNSAPYSAIT